MKSPKHKLALAILGQAMPEKFGKGKDEDAGDSEEGEEDAASGGMAQAARDFYTACKSGDWEAAGEALSDAVEICK